MSVYALSPELAAFSEASDRRFRRIATVLFIVFAIISVLIPMLRISGPEMGGGDLGERRYAEFLPDVAPPAVEEVVQEEPEPIEEPEPVEVAEPEPEPEPEPQVAERIEPEPEPVPEPSARDQVRERFADDFAALRQPEPDLITATGPSRLRRTSDSDDEASRRTDIASAARTRSGVDAEGRTRQSQPETGVGSGERRRSDVQRPAGAGAPRERTGAAGDRRTAGRSMDEIQLVFDRNKGSFYTLYNRALREDPSLRGKVTLRLTIAPDGSVSNASIVDSELNNPELERRILTRVRSLNFGAKSGVGPFTVDAYPMYFMPS